MTTPPNEKKMREFWIPWYIGGLKDAPKKVYIQALCKIGGECLHNEHEHDIFIEKTAYLQLQTKLERAVEALKFYESGKHWCIRAMIGETILDRGDVAREALKDIGEGK